MDTYFLLFSVYQSLRHLIPYKLIVYNELYYSGIIVELYIQTTQRKIQILFHQEWSCMKKRLELNIVLNSRKKLEFRQTVECLSESLLNNCSDLKIQESQDDDTFTLLIRWDSVNQMRSAIRTNEFGILIGAIKSLGKNTSIRLDDKDIGSDILKLMTL